jgi:hypothetical protein
MGDSGTVLRWSKRPVDGVKKGLVAHGQAGQFYRHLYFHIGCRFLGWPGMLASWLMHQLDVRQAATGRTESAVETRPSGLTLSSKADSAKSAEPTYQ